MPTSVGEKKKLQKRKRAHILQPYPLEGRFLISGKAYIQGTTRSDSILVGVPPSPMGSKYRLKRGSQESNTASLTGAAITRLRR